MITGQVWFCECLVGKVWCMVGTPDDSRRAARIQRDKYKSQHPYGHYRVRAYIRNEKSKG